MPPPKKRKRPAVASAVENPDLPNPISDIPPNRVGTIVQSFITNDGVKQMDVNELPDGKFMITPVR